MLTMITVGVATLMVAGGAWAQLSPENELADPAPTLGLQTGAQFSGPSTHETAMANQNPNPMHGPTLDSRDFPGTLGTLTNVASIYAGWAITCAVLDDGTARCWGGNFEGQLGNGMPHGTSFDYPVAMPVLEDPGSPLGNVAQISNTASFTSFALTPEGELWCWGRGSGSLGVHGCGHGETGPIGAGVLSISEHAGEMEFEPVKAISQGNARCFVLMDDTLRCIGANQYGQLGDGTSQGTFDRRQLDEAVIPEGLGEVRSVAAGIRHTCALKDDGSVWCWGFNQQGQLGIGTNDGPDECDSTPSCSKVPVQVEGISNAVEVTAGRWHTCALLADDRTHGEVVCWGSNTGGYLGDGGLEHSFTPVNVIKTDEDGNHQKLEGVTGLASSGGQHTCALMEDQSVRCWGLNHVGQLGTGPPTSVPRTELTPNVPMFGPQPCGGDPALSCSPSAVQVQEIDDAVAIAVGSIHQSCAIRADTTVWCWGQNSSGELGDGTLQHRSVPRPVLEADPWS